VSARAWSPSSLLTISLSCEGDIGLALAHDSLMSDVFPGKEYVPRSMDDLRAAILDVSDVLYRVQNCDVIITSRFISFS
jgi:hypothetical protein